MTIASNSKTDVFYVAESTRGTTPASPTWTPWCNTGCSLGITRDPIEGEKNNSGRQILDLRLGNKTVGGNIPGKLEHGSFDDLLEAAFMGTWSSDVLKPSTTRRSFTVEKIIDTAVKEYHRFTGVEIDTLSITLAPNAGVDIDFGLAGKGMAAVTAEVAGSTYSAATSIRMFDTYTGTITEGGSSNGFISQLELNLSNGIVNPHVLMDAETIQGSDNDSRLTGTATFFYNSKAEYEKFLNETRSEIVVTLTDPDGNSIQIDIPNLQYTAGNPEIGTEGDVTVAMEFTAIYSSPDDAQVVITRTSA